jgi:hypothetical protein
MFKKLPFKSNFVTLQKTLISELKKRNKRLDILTLHRVKFIIVDVVPKYLKRKDAVMFMVIG